MIHDLQTYRAHKEGSAVALGFFDGVHLGHRAVLKACAGSGLHRVVLTFSQPPAKTIGRACPPLLTDNARKAALLGELGADDIIFADFASLRELSPAEFVRSILYERLHAKQVYCGFNYRFGKDGSGDTALLTALCSEYGIGVTVIEPVYLDGEAVSSTRIRACIAAGEVGRAAEMLGGCYTIEGDIGGGNHIGSGFLHDIQPAAPTAVGGGRGRYHCRVHTQLCEPGAQQRQRGSRLGAGHRQHHCLSIPCVIPMIPGVLMYRSLFAFIQMHGVVGEVTVATNNMIQASLVILCIAIGVAIPNIFVRKMITTKRQEKLIKLEIERRKRHGEMVDLHEL